MIVVTSRFVLRKVFGDQIVKIIVFALETWDDDNIQCDADDVKWLMQNGVSSHVDISTTFLVD